MGIRDDQINREFEIVLRDDLGKFDLAFVQRIAVLIGDRTCFCRNNQIFRAARPRQQDTALLKRLADRSDAKGQRLGIEMVAAIVQFRPLGDLMIAGIDAAAGKDQRARCEFDLIVPHHHEDIDGIGSALAEQQNGRGWTDGAGLVKHELDTPNGEQSSLLCRFAMSPHPEERRSRVAKDEGYWHLMVRDGASAPPHHESRS